MTLTADHRSPSRGTGHSVVFVRFHILPNETSPLEARPDGQRFDLIAEAGSTKTKRRLS
jgi:hypothetical protein